MHINPFQDNSLEGPKGAYQLGQTTEGSYVRLDLPGVAPNNVRISLKTNDNKKFITVNAIAQKKEDWPLDLCDRYYGALIILDKNPTELDCNPSELEWDQVFEYGSLRLFIHGVTAKFEFLPQRASPPSSLPVVQTQLHRPILSIGTLADTHSHDGDCKCFGGTYQSLGSIAYTEEECKINPFQMGGNSSVYEKILSHNGYVWQCYVRVDVPGMKSFKPKIKSKACVISGEIDEEMNNQHKYLDEGPRGYFCSIKVECPCCDIVDNKLDLTDGVGYFRFVGHAH